MKLNIDDVASFLNLPVNTLKRWIRQGRVPIYRSDETCIFKKEKLEDWARKNNLSFTAKSCEDNACFENDDKILSCAFLNGDIFYDIDQQEKEDIFLHVIDQLDFEENFKKKFYRKLMEREDISSTGIGRGVAIPHPRDPMDEFIGPPKIISVFLKEPVDFDSIDNHKVFVLFIILCRDVREHLKVLSNLSYCLRHDKFIEFLKQKPSFEKLIKEIDSFERQLKKI